MSILIKGMEMPNNCADCPLSVIAQNEISGEQTRLCFAIPKHFASTIHKLTDCPLVEIPEGHKGHWEERHLEEAPMFLRRRWYCSECGEWQTYGRPRYCPNCGAEMEGVK